MAREYLHLLNRYSYLYIALSEIKTNKNKILK